MNDASQSTEVLRRAVLRVWWGSALLVMLAMTFIGFSPTSAHGDSVVLGSPSYLENGAGWGETRPSSISNGGVPSGIVYGIRWSKWGGKVARGVGRGAIYKPQGGYFAAKPAIPLRARSIGHCPGRAELAYKILEARFPPWPGAPPGPWLKWSGSQNLCDYSRTDPRYDYPRQPPGLCGDVGKGYEAGDLDDIRAFQVDCRKARKIAIRAEARDRSVRCSRRGCSRSVRGFHCHWQPVRSDETASAIGVPYPVQRVACKKRRATITWWSVLFFD